MRILIVNRHFGDEHVPTGRMAADVAGAFMAAGHEVTVMAARSSYSITAGSGESSNGAKLIHLYTMGEKRRLVTWFLFLLQAWARVPFTKWDRCIFLTDPPFLAAISILMRPFARSTRRDIFWWTMDLYPEILVGSGRMKERSWFYSAMRRLNCEIIRRMGGVIVLGECQRKRMMKYQSWRDENHIVVPPWDNRLIARVKPDHNRFLEKYNLRKKKVALYAGNLGEGHTFASLVDAARELNKRRRDDWAIVFVIRGSKKEQLAEAARGLSSIMVLDYQPVELTSDLLWAADVHLITMKAGAQGLVVPSKLYGVLQTDAPVLFIGPPDADTAQEINHYCAGESLGENPSGEEVLTAMDRLQKRFFEGNCTKLTPTDSGSGRIVEFVTQP